jgi:hypothetical protein
MFRFAAHMRPLPRLQTDNADIQNLFELLHSFRSRSLNWWSWSGPGKRSLLIYASKSFKYLATINGHHPCDKHRRTIAFIVSACLLWPASIPETCRGRRSPLPNNKKSGAFSFLLHHFPSQNNWTLAEHCGTIPAIACNSNVTLETFASFRCRTS